MNPFTEIFSGQGLTEISPKLAHDHEQYSQNDLQYIQALKRQIKIAFIKTGEVRFRPSTSHIFSRSS